METRAHVDDGKGLRALYRGGRGELGGQAISCAHWRILHVQVLLRFHDLPSPLTRRWGAMPLWEEPGFYGSAPALPELRLATKGGNAILQRCLLKTPIVSIQRATEDIPKGLSNARDVEESFRREVRALSSLERHPNIVVFVCEAPANIGIVLEEVVGATTLYDHLNQNTPFSLMSDWYAQLVSAVLHIHSHGFGHNDLAPGNLLITPADEGQRRLKLCDFGRSARPGERLFPASLGFTAPEVGPDVTDLDPFLADVYSVGVLIRCMALRSERGADLDDPAVVASSTSSCKALRIASEMTVDVQSRKPLKEYNVPSLPLADWPQM